MEFLEKTISCYFDPKEPLKLSIEVKGDGDFSKALLDCSAQLFLQVDSSIELEEGDFFKELVTFQGSKGLRDAFIPADLKIGDRVSFYPIVISLFEDELANQFYFLVKE